jgi:beta-galactosidase
MDNGDSSDYDQYQTNSRRMFAGKLLAIVKPDAGKKARVSARLDDEDIPIRKIELDINNYEIKATVFPPNATYSDLTWRLTDEAGIDSPLGSLTVSADGKSASLAPRGDGEVYIRCCAKNGKDHIALISLRALVIEGMGKPFLDPYSFVSAGLCNYSNVELTNGNERGMATLRGTESHMGFKDVDFGDYGSDEITLPLFPLEGNPFEFEIWEGMPNEGGEKLCAVIYDKGSIWNIYQDVTYKLPRRLKGVTALCLVFRQKVHVKGFIFTAYRKAFQKLTAPEADSITGDSFEVKTETVEKIGNNVSLIFGGMDFGEKGTARIALGWKSKLAKNSIQIIFTDESDTIRKMIIVDGSTSWTEGIFPLGETITGKKTVTLSFLPGCNIDLAWIRFMPS